MSRLLILSAILLHVAHGRRVQREAINLNNEGEVSQEEKQVENAEPSAQSFVEVKAGFAPLSAVGRLGSTLAAGIAGIPAVHMPNVAQVPPSAAAKMPRVPAAAMHHDPADPDHVQSDLQYPKEATEKKSQVETAEVESKGAMEAAVTDYLPSATKAAIMQAQSQPVVQADVEPTQTKEPWYANLRLNMLILLLAKIGSRIALRFKSNVAFDKADPTRRAAVTMSATDEKKGFLSGIDFPLLSCFALWYVGNYYYNITNKLALNAAGGAAGFPMTIATLQLGVGVVYAIFLWLAPDARKKPEISFSDYLKTLPVGFTAAGAHAASVFALSAGAVSFAQIVKAAEPAFAAVLGVLFYGASVSVAKWICLVPVIGGVILASLGELSFAWVALATAAIANVFAAIKGNENKKLMSTEGLAERIGSVGNQFALTSINAFLFCLPLMFLTEGAKLGQFWTLCKTSPVVLNNMLFSGLWFYLYNELATLTIKKTNAVTQSVANTAKRVIVIIVVALVMGESLGALKLIGCGIGIGGVFLYSIIDKLVAKKASPPATA